LGVDLSGSYFKQRNLSQAVVEGPGSKYPLPTPNLKLSVMSAYKAINMTD
jgi:hypothetical protein